MAIVCENLGALAEHIKLCELSPDEHNRKSEEPVKPQ